MEKVIIGNVCFIRDRATKKILLLKRKNDPTKGTCTGVGGKTHFQEDIRASCFREVKEETGLDITDMRLKGILKTILDGKDSSWILFVYVADTYEGELGICDEGELSWVSEDELYSKPILPFVRELLSYILDETSFFEGTIRHDTQGMVLEKDITVAHLSVREAAFASSI